MAAKDRFKFYFQNSCDNIPVSTFTPSDNGGKQAFTVTGQVISDYLDEGDELSFNYSGSFYTYTVIDITGSQITMSFDYNASITNVNTYLQFSVKTQCHPHDFYKGKFEWTKDKDNYFYKMKYNGKVTFKGADYQYLFFALDDQCCNVTLKAFKLCEGEYSLYYRSSINRTEGTWDESQCWFETEMLPIDKYKCILANQDVEINLYECDQDTALFLEDDALGGQVSSPFFEYLVRATAPVAPGDTYSSGSGALWSQVNGTGGYASDPNTGNPWTIYSRELKVVTYSGDPISFVTPAIGGYTIDSEQRIDGKIIVRYTKQVAIADAPLHFLEVWGSGGDCIPNGPTSIFYDPVNDNCINLGNPDDGTLAAYNSVYLNDVLELMGSKCGGIQYVTSDFFELNPIGDTAGYSSGVNYVTSMYNFLTELKLSHISDVLNVGGDTATYLGYSFSRLMKDLNYMFNVYWFIDSEQRLRIEHASWFSFNNIVNLSTDRLNINKLRYTYIKEQLPSREKFTFKYALNADFVGADIVYSQLCTDSPTTKLRASEMTTDMYYLRNTPKENFSTDGIVMFCTQLGNFAYDTGMITGMPLQNGHLSWATLHYNYHFHGRILEEGLMNYDEETFTTWLKTRQQTNQISTDCCLDIPDTLGHVITQLGTGDANKIVYNLSDNTFEFELSV